MLNFGRYLERLGIKTGHQPVLLDTIQPVLLVGDQRNLVSRSLLCSYLVGASEPPSAAQFGAFLVQTPVPLSVDLYLGGASSGLAAIEIGAGVAPVINSPTVLVAQRFRPETAPEAQWLSGDLVAAPSELLPALGVTSTSSTRLAPRIYVPAGGWLLGTYGNFGSAFRWTARVDELPNELPQ